MAEKDLMKMNYPTNNSCWRSCENKLCSWGQRAKPRTIDGSFRGMTAPLWKNPAKSFFIVICVIAFCLAVLFVIAFLVINYKNDDILDSSEKEAVKDENDLCIIACKDELKPAWIVIGAILIFINAFCYCFIGCKEYASDQEWSRYLIITSILCVILIGVNVFHYIETIDHFKFYNDDKDKVFIGDYKSECKQLFVANLVLNFFVAVSCSIVEILVLIRVFFIGKDFFMKSYVPHTAKCVDDDIIVIE